ncbi:MAG: GNAT family N-acetyltransferase [Planctomycetota bacterium]|nr:MAG: GNAT family N-acetyltransferase [Planctomycetota bacterium]
MTTLVRVQTPAQLTGLRRLLAEYVDSLPVDIAHEGFAKEWAGLPGAYAPPRGELLLASVDGQPAGCVALRPIDADTGEMKRFYVRPAFRGRGIGRALAGAVVDAARRIGYRRLLLDTHPTMTAAIALYRSMGFRETASYRSIPVREEIFMELDLTTVTSASPG